MFGALGAARNSAWMSFLPRATVEACITEEFGLRNPIGTDAGTRELRKADLMHNHEQPDIEVDPRTYEVRAAGNLLTCDPASERPMAQRYFLF